MPKRVYVQFVLCFDRVLAHSFLITLLFFMHQSIISFFVTEANLLWGVFPLCYLTTV